jgi:hypothetical protein
MNNPAASCRVIHSVGPKQKLYNHWFDIDEPTPLKLKGKE